jgi:chaperonin GroEL (HSP60 family)
MVYDVLTRGFVEWWAGGIMDPAKVTLKALENALSVAQLLMTCGGVVANKVDPESERIQQMQDGMLKAIEGEALA